MLLRITLKRFVLCSLALPGHWSAHVQVEFEDSMPPGKRRRGSSESAGGMSRPDVLSGLIGKRVWVPRRARSAMCAPAPRAAHTDGATHTDPQSACQRTGSRGNAPANAHADSAVSAEAKDAQEEFAVMGLLSLCEAS
jgi:hypothetical protein